MYEGIEDIYQLLDTGRVKEALTQLLGIGMQTNHWNIRNWIENTLTEYGYMLQYAEQGMEDPNRAAFFRQARRTAYELTDEMNIALLSLKKSAVFYDTIRTAAIHPFKAYGELQMQLETYTEDVSTAPLLYPDEKRLQAELEHIGEAHEAVVAELFNKTWTSIHWTDSEAEEAHALLKSVLIHPSDLSVMVSAVTMNLLRVFDAKKLHWLFEAYRHEEVQVSQRAIVGMVIALMKHEKRIQLYPEICSRLSLLCEEEKFRKNLYTIQMQLLITRETTKIDKKMREEILPEMMKNAKQLSDPKFRFDESEESEDRNPEWEEWMDKSGMSDKIKEMSEWQMAGADVYMSSFAQLKHYPFFHQIAHWFYPFDLSLPMLAPLKKEFDSPGISPIKLIAHSDFFCNSDKFSFALAILSMPKDMRKMSMMQMEEQARMNEEQRDRLELLMQQKKEAKGISRQYIQDLYRFFKLWKRHQEEEDIFHWKFDLWDNSLLKETLQEESTCKELADYLLEKDYLEEAYPLYQRLMQANSTQAEVWQKAGYIRQKQKQYTEAIRHYEHADILKPDQVWTNKHLAQCYRLNGDYEMALEYYRKVEAVQPDNLSIALQIGQCLVRKEEYAEALAYFYKVEYLEKNPDNARRAIAWCSFVSGKYEEALKYYRLVLEGASPKAHDWMNAGHVHLACRRMKEALEHYRKAQSYEKTHTDFIGKFYKDKAALLSQGLSEEDLSILLDLLVS